jgi:hypothetical protein
MNANTLKENMGVIYSCGTFSSILQLIAQRWLHKLINSKALQAQQWYLATSTMQGKSFILQKRLSTGTLGSAPDG